MENQRNPWLTLFLGLVAFSILGSAAETFLRVDAGLIKPVTGAITILSGVFALLSQISQDESRTHALKAFFGLFCIGASAELIGLYTGFPFGKYVYTTSWAPVLSLPGGHFFPILLPLAWVMVVTCCYTIFARTLAGLTAVFLAALLATLADIPLEFAVIKSLGYWKWLDSSWPLGDIGFGVPILNSIGWFVTSFLGAFWLSKLHQPSQFSRDVAVKVLAGLTVLMIALSIFGVVSKPNLGKPQTLGSVNQ